MNTYAKAVKIAGIVIGVAGLIGSIAVGEVFNSGLLVLAVLAGTVFTCVIVLGLGELIDLSHCQCELLNRQMDLYNRNEE